jgi:hypothetical protein
MNELVTIKSYMASHELLVDRSKLESFGIECFTRDEMTSQVLNFYSHLKGGIQLQVRKSDLQKAREILADELNGDTEERN